MDEKTGEQKKTIFVGLSVPDSQGDAAAALQDARIDGYDFVTTEILNAPRADAIQLHSAEWSRCVVGIARSCNMEWALHMNLPAVLLPPIYIYDIPSYSQALAQQAVKAQTASFQLWVPMTLSAQSLSAYQMVYRMCGENQRVSACLMLEPVEQVTNPTHFIASQMRLLHVALGCNIRCVVLPTNIFLTNKRGYPTLAKSTQVILTELLRRIGRTVRFIIKGQHLHSLSDSVCGQTKCLPYLQYLQHLRSRAEVQAAIDTAEAKDEERYLDVLQRPLQPLKDHLEFGTYEVFERDPVKYEKYKQAMAWALQDCASLMAIDDSTTRDCTLFVVGAGRGPLVTSAMEAYQQVRESGFPELQLTIVAIEKNPSAVLYLQSKAQCDSQWKAFAQDLLIVQKDLRELKLVDVGDRHCDIVVSELLGSFGDNELSPECLNAFYSTEVCHSSTISIPQRYTAYISLVNSAALHLEARNQALYPNEDESGVIGMQKAMETPYVVRPHAASQITEEQPCWTFEHPTAIESRERQASLEFAPSLSCGVGFGSGYGGRDRTVESMVAAGSLTDYIPWTLTGLLGTFTADLYTRGNDVCQISTTPSNFSTGMFSWFPLYFPLKESIMVPNRASVRVYMWRREDSSRTWYEWSVDVHRDGELLTASPIHNLCGRSYHVSM